MYMEAHPNIAILTPRVLNEDGTEQYLPKKRISVHYLLGGLFENYGKLFRRWRADFNNVTRRSVLQKVRDRT